MIPPRNKIFVHKHTGEEEAILVNISGKDKNTVDELKYVIWIRVDPDLEPELQRLIYAGRQLEDECKSRFPIQLRQTHMCNDAISLQMAATSKTTTSNR